MKGFTMKAISQESLNKFAISAADVVEASKRRDASVASAKETWRPMLQAAFDAERLKPWFKDEIEAAGGSIPTARGAKITEVSDAFMLAYVLTSTESQDAIRAKLDMKPSTKIDCKTFRSYVSKCKGKPEYGIKTVLNNLQILFKSMGYSIRHKESTGKDAKGWAETFKKAEADLDVITESLFLYSETLGQGLDIESILRKLPADDVITFAEALFDHREQMLAARSKKLEAVAVA